jgi:hypothetical protein
VAGAAEVVTGAAGVAGAAVAVVAADAAAGVLVPVAVVPHPTTAATAAQATAMIAASCHLMPVRCFRARGCCGIVLCM